MSQPFVTKDSFPTISLFFKLLLLQRQVKALVGLFPSFKVSLSFKSNSDKVRYGMISPGVKEESKKEELRRVLKDNFSSKFGDRLELIGV